MERNTSRNNSGFFSLSATNSMDLLACAHEYLPDGLDLSVMLPNGDCMFSAVLFSILPKDQRLCHANIQDLRQQTASYLNEHSEEFEGFFEEGAFHHHVEAIERPGTPSDPEGWGGDHEIVALSKLLERTIIVIGPDGKIRNKCALTLDQNEQLVLQDEPIFILYDGIEHYDALLRKEDFSLNHIIEQLMSSSTKEDHAEQTLEHSLSIAKL